jgi:hypothetical protein
MTEAVLWIAVVKTGLTFTLAPRIEQRFLQRSGNLTICIAPSPDCFVKTICSRQSQKTNLWFASST